MVTVPFKAEGTQAADYAGAINQEKHLDLDQAWRFETADGVIMAVTAYWCQAQLYRRLSAAAVVTEFFDRYRAHDVEAVTGLCSITARSC